MRPPLASPGTLLLALLALPIAGCGRAEADALVRADPVSCATVFSMVAVMERSESGNTTVAKEMGLRTLYIANQQGGTWLEDVTPQAAVLSKRLGASDEDALPRLVKDCLSHQDEDPRFRAALPGLPRRG